MSFLSDMMEQRSGFDTLMEMINLAKREQQGGPVGPKQALTLSAVYRSATLISSTVAGLPLKAFRPEREHLKRNHEIEGPSVRILEQPNPVMTGFELREIQTAHLVLWGNSYTLKIRDGSNRVKELWPIDPSIVRVKLQGDRKIFEVRPQKGKAFTTDATDIMHIPAFGYDGVKGLSPIGLARENLTEQMAARSFAGGIYKSGAIAAGLIKTPMRLRKEQAEEIKQRWKDSIGGIENAGDIGVLDRGFEFEKMSIDPQDLQFLETRQFGVNEIARLYGIPPHLLSDVERSTSWGTGIEEQTLGFITYTLQPGYMTRIEKRYTAEGIVPAGAFAEFVIDGLLRSRAKDRADVYTRALSPFTGWMTRAEVRELENLDPEPDPPDPEEEPETEPDPEEEPEGEPNEPDPDDIPGVRFLPEVIRVCSYLTCKATPPPGRDTCLRHRNIGGQFSGKK